MCSADGTKRFQLPQAEHTPVSSSKSMSCRWVLLSPVKTSRRNNLQIPRDICLALWTNICSQQFFRQLNGTLPVPVELKMNTRKTRTLDFQNSHVPQVFQAHFSIFQFSIGETRQRKRDDDLEEDDTKPMWAPAFRKLAAQLQHRHFGRLCNPTALEVLRWGFICFRSSATRETKGLEVVTILCKCPRQFAHNYLNEALSGVSVEMKNVLNCQRQSSLVGSCQR